jgi:hypothetical protein
VVSASPEEETVVTRMWRGWTRSEDADRYRPGRASGAEASGR